MYEVTIHPLQDPPSLLALFPSLDFFFRAVCSPPQPMWPRSIRYCPLWAFPFGLALKALKWWFVLLTTNVGGHNPPPFKTQHPCWHSFPLWAFSFGRFVLLPNQCGTSQSTHSFPLWAFPFGRFVLLPNQCGTSQSTPLQDPASLLTLFPSLGFPFCACPQGFKMVVTSQSTHFKTQHPC